LRISVPTENDEITLRPIRWHSADEAAHPYIFTCSKPNCWYSVSATTEAAAIERGKHKCPRVAGITHFGASVTLTLLEEAWIAADRVYERVSTEDLDDKKMLLLRGELNGYCKFLAMFSKPYFGTAKEVGDEIRKRHNMRTAGEDYETPGLGSRRYELADARKGVAMPAAERATKVLTPEEVQTIKAASAGGFSPEQIAQVYEVTLDVVKSVIS
jgi:hypothetical protein